MQADRQGLIGRGIEVLCRVVLYVSTAVIFAILVANTAMRYTTGASLDWASEVPELLFPWLVMAGVVLAAQQNAHIATTFLLDALPARTRHVVATVAWLSVAGLYLVLSWATFGMLDIVQGEVSPILQMPGSITYACVMVGMLLLAVLALQSAWHSWRTRAVAMETLEPHAPSVHW